MSTDKTAFAARQGKGFRRFEVSKEAIWMNKSIDDRLYGLIQYLATYNPNETVENHKLYLTQQSYSENRKDIQALLGLTQRTLANHLKRLIEKGLIEEFVKDNVFCYGIVVNRDMPYKKITREWLRYLLNTKNPISLRIYFILLDWYEYKRDYVFTQKQIAELIGFSGSSTLGSNCVKDNLKALAREGIIEVESFYEQVMKSGGETVPVPKLRLKFVAVDEKQLSAVDV